MLERDTRQTLCVAEAGDVVGFDGKGEKVRYLGGSKRRMIYSASMWCNSSNIFIFNIGLKWECT